MISYFILTLNFRAHHQIFAVNVTVSLTIWKFDVYHAEWLIAVIVIINFTQFMFFMRDGWFFIRTTNIFSHQSS